MEMTPAPKDVMMLDRDKWTVESVRDYLLALIASNDQRYTLAHSAVMETMHAAEKLSTARREVLHELIHSNDRRYEESFTQSRRNVELAFSQQQTSLSAALEAQKEAVNTAFISAEKAVNAALTAASLAVNKAENAAEKRFEGVNEFRGQLADQQRTLMPRAEVEVIVKSLTEKVDNNADALRRQIEAYNTRIASSDGQSKGINVGWGFAVGIIGVVLALIGVFLKVTK